MKLKFTLFTCCMIFVIASFSQNRFPSIDKSPLDLAYYPNNYPVLKIQNKVTEPLTARLLYSRPQKNGRVVFGELVEYEKVWRLGANEATEIEFYKDVKIGSTKVKKGRYALLAIPMADTWTFILNKETDVWGAFIYDSKKDILRINVKTEKSVDTIEAFSAMFEKADKGIYLVIAWDNTLAKLLINL